MQDTLADAMWMPLILCRPRLVVSALVLTLAAFLSLQAHAEILPTVGVPKLCMQADLIVSGHYEGGDKLRIEEVLHPANSGLKVGAVMEVPALAVHSRKLFKFAGADAQQAEINTRKLLLFAEHDKRGQPVPIWHIEQGSQGVIWHSEHICYSYRQIINPGGYLLQELHLNADRQAVGKAQLWKEVKSGIQQRRLWEDIKAIEPMDRRVHAMASLFLKATPAIPGLDEETLADELKAVGSDAIVPIAEVLDQLQPDEPADQLFFVLNYLAVRSQRDRELDHKPLLEPVVAPLANWLKTCKTSRPHTALDILKVAADPKAAEAVRPFLGHEEASVKVRAALALTAMKDMESFEAIADLVRNAGDDRKLIRGLGQCLLKLDAERAAPIIDAAVKGVEEAP